MRSMLSLSSSRLAMSTVTNPVLDVELVQAQIEDADDPQPGPPRHRAHRRQAALRREHGNRVADVDGELRRQVLSENHAAEDAIAERCGQGGHRSLGDRTRQVGDARFERGIDPLERDERFLARRRHQRFADDRRGRPDDVRQLAKPDGLGLVVHDAAGLEHIHVGLRPEDAIAQFLLQAGHQRQRDHHRHHADDDAERGDERDDGQQRLLAFRQQVPERDMELERHVHRVARPLVSGRDRPRKHDNTQKHPHSRAVVPSCLRGCMLEVIRTVHDRACASMETE